MINIRIFDHKNIIFYSKSLEFIPWFMVSLPRQRRRGVDSVPASSISCSHPWPLSCGLSQGYHLPEQGLSVMEKDNSQVRHEIFTSGRLIFGGLPDNTVATQPEPNIHLCYFYLFCNLRILTALSWKIMSAIFMASFSVK